MAAASTSIGVVVDGAIVSHLISPKGFAAINLAVPLQQLLVTFHLLLNMGAAMLIAFAIGKGSRSEANGYFSMAVCCDLLIGLLCLVGGGFFSERIAHLLCSDAELFPLVHDYAKVLLLTGVVYLLLPGLCVFVRTDGSPRLATMALVVANITNIILDILFIKYLNWGIEGASWATSISYLIGIGVTLIHFRKPFAMLCFCASVKGVSFGRVILMGVPMALASICMIIRLLSMNHIVLYYWGAVGMSILSACFNLLILANVFVTGTVQAMQPIAAIFKGQEDSQGVRIVVNNAFKFLLACQLVYVSLILVFPSLFSGLFGLNGPDIAYEVNLAIRMAALSFLPFSLIYLLMVVYQLLEEHGLAIFVSVAQSLAAVPVMYLLARFVSPMIWLSFLIGEGIVFLMILSASVYKRRCDSSLAFLTLLPTGVLDKSIDFSIKREMGDFFDSLRSIDSFLKENRLDVTVRNQVNACCEELILNIIKHGRSDTLKHYIDVRILLFEDKVRISIKDDGIPFDPIRYDEKTGFGLLIVKNFCKDMEYKYIWGQNMVFLNISNPHT